MPARAWIPLALTAAVAAQGPTLIRDIDPTPRPPVGSAPDELVTWNGRVYFTASATGVGRELFATDGTTAGTVLIADAVPGADGSWPSHLTGIGSHMVFWADRDLWVTDGTTAGTARVREFDDDVIGIAASGTTAWVLARRAGLWRTDGTAAGTAALHGVPAQPYDAHARGDPPRIVADTSGRAFFAAYDAQHAVELWMATTSSVGFLADLAPGITFGRPDSSNPQRMLPFGSGILFAAEDGNSIRPALYASDGTTPGTGLVVRISPTALRADPAHFTVFQGHAWFAATEGQHGRELWRTDGTAANTVRVTDIAIGPASASPEQLAAFGAHLYFAADDGVHGVELWRTDGTTSGTALVADIHAGSTGSAPSGLRVIAGRLWFAADDGVHGRELWSTDGTATGTVLVRDIAPGAAGSDAQSVREIGALGVFAADDGVHGLEPWVSDGTSAGTRILGDLRVDPANPTRASFPRLLVAEGPHTFFVADDGVHGAELWSTDGTSAGTQLLVDIRAGSAAGPYEMGYAHGHAGDTFLFAPVSVGPGPPSLWRSDGTPAGTYVVHPVVSNLFEFGFREIFHPFGDRMLFASADPTYGEEPWITDGSVAGTRLLKDLSPGAGGSSSVLGIVDAYARVFLVVFDYTDVWLWETDGSMANTRRVTRLAGAVQQVAVQTCATRRGLFVLVHVLDTQTSTLYRSDGTAAGTVPIRTGVDQVWPVAGGDLALRIGNELWWSDGTAANTHRVRAFTWSSSIPSGSTPRALAVTDRARVVFIANDGVSGDELWTSDGTPAGTVMLADAVPGSDGLEVFRLATIGDHVLFPAEDPVTGRELWSSDGTASGTMRLRDVWPGPESGITDEPPVRIGATRAIFVGGDPATGFEPWITDGTPAGTKRVADVQPGGESSVGVATQMAARLSGGQVVFVADDGVRGSEPWRWSAGAVSVRRDTGCAAIGSAPELRTTDPVLGQPLVLTVAEAVSNRAGLLVWSLPAPLRAFGPCSIRLHATAAGVFLPLSTDANGGWSGTIPVPASPSLVGGRLGLQAWIGPTTAPLGFDVTNGVSLTLGR